MEREAWDVAARENGCDGRQPRLAAWVGKRDRSSFAPCPHLQIAIWGTRPPPSPVLFPEPPASRKSLWRGDRPLNYVTEIVIVVAKNSGTKNLIWAANP